MVGEPPRLLEDEREAESLRLDLGRATRHAVDYDVAAGLAVFEASLGQAGTEVSSAKVAAAVRGGGVAAGKVVALVLGVVTLGVIAVVGLRGSDDRGGVVAPVQRTRAPKAVQAGSGGDARGEAPKKLRVRSQDRASDEARPSAGSEVPSAVTVEPRASAQPPREANPRGRVLSERERDPSPKLREAQRPQPAVSGAGAARSARDPAGLSQPTAGRLSAEMAAMNRARQALRSDPRRALKLVGEADGEFPRGLFVEQRAGLAVLARLAIGDKGARSAAERYLKRYRHGTYADKVRQAMGDAP